MLQTSCKTWAFKNNKNRKKTPDREKTNQIVEQLLSFRKGYNNG